MCTYNIVLDDKLVAQAKSSLSHSGIELQPWLQHQVERLLLQQINRTNKVFIADGEVKMNVSSAAIDLEEARQLLHEMVDLEYSLP
jgi:hypothetical protein